MARQNVYMPQKIHDEIRVIVDERRADGASHADANISSVCSEMLDIGVRVTMNLKKKEKEVHENGVSWEDMYKKKILEDSTKTRLCMQTIFQMLFDLQEIKSDTRYDFRQEVLRMKHETEVMLDNFFIDKER